jgi:hypothetical protein
MVSDLAASNVANQIVANYGLDKAAEAVQSELDAHNAIVQDIIGELALPAETRIEAAGGPGSMKMFRAGEHSRVPTQKIGAAYNLGYPIEKFQIALGWTDEWFRRKTVAELAAQVAARRFADLVQVFNEIKRALFLSANYNHDDIWEDPVAVIPVKRLANADGQYIGPNQATGQTFDGATHTHYLAGAALTNALALSLVNTVLEHFPSGSLRIAIALADRSEWEALTEFRPYAIPGTVPTPGDSTTTMDQTRNNDIAIGTLGGAQVWVKPWGLDNYPTAYDPARKPLRYRERQGVGLQGLFVAAQNRAYPWLAEYAEHYYGLGVKERTGAAVLYVGGGSYVDPTIPA